MAQRRGATIRDVARETGLSAATVSVALNGRNGSVSISDETRQSVTEAAERLGYDLGRLRTRRTSPRAVTIFCPGGHSPNEPIHYHLVLEITRLLLLHQSRAILEPYSAAPNSLAAAVERVRRGQSDAAIAVAALHLLPEMETWGVPCVYVGDVPADVNVCRVHVDNDLGGRLAAEHLWSLGHRHIGVVQVPYGTCAEKRFESLRSTWRDRGADIPDHAVLNVPAVDYHELTLDLPLMLRRCKAAGAPLTAIFCNSDWLASAALRVLRDLNLRVPEDISVIGFDDAHYAELLAPPLTTIRQPFPELGALAVQLLLEQASVDEQLDKAYILPCQLVARESTAAPGR